MNQRIELSGKTFGWLTVIGPSEKPARGSLKWRCICQCGKEKAIAGAHLRGGAIRSCGCLRDEVAGARNKTHGEGSNQTPEYKCWANMIQRCSEHAREDSRRNYFERGIRVCQEWRSSYERFLSDMGRRPAYGMEIDRIDNDGNYEPGNCRWAVKAIQSTNKRTNDVVVYHGQTMVFKRAWEASSRVVGYGTAHSRHWRDGWPVDQAIDTPPLKSKGRREAGSRHWVPFDEFRRSTQRP